MGYMGSLPGAYVSCPCRSGVPGLAVMTTTPLTRAAWWAPTPWSSTCTNGLQWPRAPAGPCRGAELWPNDAKRPLQTINLSPFLARFYFGEKAQEHCILPGSQDASRATHCVTLGVPVHPAHAHTSSQLGPPQHQARVSSTRPGCPAPYGPRPLMENDGPGPQD